MTTGMIQELRVAEEIVSVLPAGSAMRVCSNERDTLRYAIRANGRHDYLNLDVLRVQAAIDQLVPARMGRRWQRAHSQANHSSRLDVRRERAGCGYPFDFQQFSHPRWLAEDRIDVINVNASCGILDHRSLGVGQKTRNHTADHGAMASVRFLPCQEMDLFGRS